jgi:hypothetical protein
MTLCHIICTMCLVGTSNAQHAYNVKKPQKPLKAGTTKFGDGRDTRDGVHYTTEASQGDDVVLTLMESSFNRAAFNATSNTNCAVSLSVMESSRKFSGGCPGSLGLHHRSIQAAAQCVQVVKIITFIGEL